MRLAGCVAAAGGCDAASHHAWACWLRAHTAVASLLSKTVVPCAQYEINSSTDLLNSAES
jgi:hypothetical protein